LFNFAFSDHGVMEHRWCTVTVNTQKKAAGFQIFEQLVHVFRSRNRCELLGYAVHGLKEKFFVALHDFAIKQPGMAGAHPANCVWLSA
jgi:hypothetical protein